MSPFVSAKINGLRSFLENSKFYILTATGHLNMAGVDTMLVTMSRLEKPVGVLTSWE